MSNNLLDLSFGIKRPDGYVSDIWRASTTRSHTAAAPTREAEEIVARALALLERTEAGRRPIRLLGAGVHGLAGEEGALGLPGSLKFDG